ncbi:MAG: xylan 1,4-beta-xylosidase [Clostridia bacterium]|nr:xylan 1,4-beta-xylosidase [Clostridia bacterium]
MANINSRFTVKKEKGSYPLTTYVLVDKETGVNYLYTAGGYGGGLTPLLNADGKPIVTHVIEEE